MPDSASGECVPCQVGAAGCGSLADRCAVAEHHRGEFLGFRRANIAVDPVECDFCASDHHATDPVSEPASRKLFHQAVQQAVTGWRDWFGLVPERQFRLAGEDITPKEDQAAPFSLLMWSFTSLRLAPSFRTNRISLCTAARIWVAPERSLPSGVFMSSLSRTSLGAVEHHALAVLRQFDAAAVVQLDLADEVWELVNRCRRCRDGAGPGEGQQDKGRGSGVRESCGGSHGRDLLGVLPFVAGFEVAVFRPSSCVRGGIAASLLRRR